MKKFTGPEKNQRVVTFLAREEVDFLDKVGKDALFSTGMKLSRAKLIAWLVEFVEKMKINGEGIKSEDDFQKKITEVMFKDLRGSVPPVPLETKPIKADKFLTGPATGE